MTRGFGCDHPDCEAFCAWTVARGTFVYNTRDENDKPREAKVELCDLHADELAALLGIGRAGAQMSGPDGDFWDTGDR